MVDKLTHNGLVTEVRGDKWYTKDKEEIKLSVFKANEKLLDLADSLDIKDVVSIPVMAKCRIGHTLEAKILESLKVDFIDESEVLTPADNEFHVYKNDFSIPFVCGARDLGEALRRIQEGAAMIRTKGEAGSGNIVEAVTHMKTIVSEINHVKSLSDKELKIYSKEKFVKIRKGDVISIR